MGRPTNAQRAARAAKEQIQEVPQPPIGELMEEAQSPVRERSQYIDIKDDARDQIMEEIVKRSQGEDHKEEPKEEPKAEPKADAPKEEVKAETKPEEAKAEAKVEEAKLEVPQMVKAKVDGEEFDVSQAEIDEAGGLKAWQKERAAENRLKKANEALAESRKIQEQIKEMARPQPAPVPVISNDEFIKQKMDIIRFGSPEESAAAFQEVLARANPKTDANQIVLQATTNFNHDQALRKFRADFQDIATNPVLSRLIQPLAQEALAPYTKAGTADWASLSQLDWPEFYNKIGNSIRGAVPRQSQPQPTAATTGNPSPATSDKEARKASIVNPQTGAARAELPKEEKEESREDIVRAMKKERGIPVD